VTIEQAQAQIGKDGQTLLKLYGGSAAIGGGAGLIFASGAGGASMSALRTARSFFGTKEGRRVVAILMALGRNPNKGHFDPGDTVELIKTLERISESSRRNRQTIENIIRTIFVATTVPGDNQSSETESTTSDAEVPEIEDKPPRRPNPNEEEPLPTMAR